ncbi:MAG: energy transducer TonB [Bacteroidota bacterium]
MKKKKSILANLENKRFLLFELGLIIALAIILSAFEYGTNEKHHTSGSIKMEEIPEYDISITFPEDEKPEPEKPEPRKKEDVFDEIELIDNTDDNDSDVDFDSGDTEKVDNHAFVEIDYPEEETDPIEPYFAEELPAFPDGHAAMMNFINSNISYPRNCVEQNISGTVFVRFIVNKKGEVVDVEIYRSIHPDLDKAALEVVNKMPEWIPGKQNGNRIPVYQILPIHFVLE